MNCNIDIPISIIEKIAKDVNITMQSAFSLLELYPQGKISTTKKEDGRFIFLTKIAKWVFRQKNKGKIQEYNRNYYVSKKRYIKKKDRVNNDT